MYKYVVVAVMAAFAGPLAAQGTARPDPADARAKVPAVEHRSALEGYRRYEEPQVGGWRELNDETGRVGGHLGILRGQTGAKAPAKPHGGHK